MWFDAAMNRSIARLVLVVTILSLVACASHTNQLRLSDLGTRHWKGTVYLSVAGTPTSIKCSTSSDYSKASDVPVSYQGQDAEALFSLDDDLEKIRALKQECFERSFSK